MSDSSPATGSTILIRQNEPAMQTPGQGRFSSVLVTTSNGGPNIADDEMVSVEKALTSYVGDPLIARALLDWEIRTGRCIQIPARMWQRTGNTGARLIRLYVADGDHGPRLVVVKVLPPGPASEAAAHRRAVREAPEAFRVHLADQVFDADRLPDGRVLTFQIPADLGDGMIPLADVPLMELPAVLETVTSALIGDWNPHWSLTETTVAVAMREELALHPSAGCGLTPRMKAAPHWFGLHGVVMPNPAHLLGHRSVLGPERLDLTIGRVHRDLHDRNLIVGGMPANFTLVDLTFYASCGQLGQDPVRMLLCAIGRLLEEELSDSQGRHLLNALIRPTGAPSPLLPPLATDIRDAVYRPAARLLHGCGTWPNQFLLTLITQGLAMSTFVDLGHRRRWWFFQLAASAARELLIRLGREHEFPGIASPMDNPFARSSEIVDLADRLPHHRRSTETAPDPITERLTDDPACHLGA